MSKRKQFVSIVCLVAMAVMSVFGFFAVSNTETVSADTVTLTETESSVTDVFVLSGFLWFKIPESDYADAGNSYSITTDYLSQFVDSFSTKILIDDVALSSLSSFSDKDPYLNLWQKVTPSFAFVCSAPSSKITVKAGAKFPSYAYINDLANGGTGENKAVYVTQQDVTFVKQGDGWVNQANIVTLTETEATVTNVGVYLDFSFLWFQIPESDYENAGDSYSIKNSLEESQAGVTQTKYISVLSQFNDALFGKIEVDGNLLSDYISDFSGRDPYFNLWNQINPSFSFALSSQAKSTVIVHEGAKFPSYAYINDLANGGTGENKAVYVIKENAYFVGKDGTWTTVTKQEYYNAEVLSFATASKSDSSYATVSLVGGKYGSAETDLSSYTEKLNALNTTSYIKINDVKLSEHTSYSGKTLAELNPYFNYNGTTGFSLGIEVSTSDTVTFMQGCQIPNEGFIAGTGLCNTVKKDVTFIYNSEKSAWQEYIPEQDLTSLFAEARKVGWEDGVKVEIDVNYQFDDVGNGAFLVDSVGSEKGLLDYITVNGKSVNQINSENSSNTYTFTTFPGSVGGRYATATYVLMTNIGATGNRINLYIHKDYYKTLTDVVVGVSKDFVFYDGATNFTVTKAVTFKEIYGSFINTEDIKGEKDITATVNAAKTEIRPDGSVSIRVDLSTVNLTNIGYGVNNINAASVFDYVKVNGKTLSEINSATDTSAYDWNIGKPFSDGADYHKAINVYFTAGFMNLRIHPEYVKTVIGDAAINVSVNVGFKLFDTDDGYEYVLSAATEGRGLAARYTLTVQSGETVLGEEKLIAGSKINLTNYTPVKDYYDLVGYTDVDGNDVASVMPESNYTVKAKFNPTVYTVTFKNGNTTVDKLTYTVENAEITAPSLPEADEHHTAEWETYVLDGGNKTVNLQLVAKIYTVTFKNGDTVVATVNYTVDDIDIIVPEVPVKEGYKGGWNFYTLDGGNKTVNAVYEEILTPATENGGCSSGIDGAFIVGISSLMLAVFVLTKKLRRANSK